jgi:hypothetical protein
VTGPTWHPTPDDRCGDCGVTLGPDEYLDGLCGECLEAKQEGDRGD